MKRNILYVEDWRYRIGYNNEVLEQVLLFAEGLKRDEREVYRNLIDFYSDNIFLIRAISDIRETKDEELREEMVTEIECNIEKCIPVLPLLYKYEDIEDEDLNNRIIKILADALEQGKEEVSTRRVMKELFGKYYIPILKEIFTDKEEFQPKMERNEVINEMFGSYVEKCIEHVFSTGKIAYNFGTPTVGSYEVEYLENPFGTAVWMDKDLYNLTQDKYTVFLNENNMCNLEMKYRICRDIYPGKAHLLNYIKGWTKDDYNLDYGASSLIEGWATYCLWNGFKGCHTDHIRKRDIEFLKISLSNLSTEGKANKVIEMFIRDGFSMDYALERLLYMVQYPGHLEAPIFGALVIEKIMKDRGYKLPKDFLTNMEDTWGEILSLL